MEVRLATVKMNFDVPGIEGELHATSNEDGFQAEAWARSEQFRAWVDLVVGTFTNENGINYVTFTGTKQGFGDFEVTIRKADGKTPAQALVEKQMEIDNLKAKIASFRMCQVCNETKVHPPQATKITADGVPLCAECYADLERTAEKFGLMGHGESDL